MPWTELRNSISDSSSTRYVTERAKEAKPQGTHSLSGAGIFELEKSGLIVPNLQTYPESTVQSSSWWTFVLWWSVCCMWRAERWDDEGRQGEKRRKGKGHWDWRPAGRSHINAVNLCGRARRDDDASRCTRERAMPEREWWTPVTLLSDSCSVLFGSVCTCVIYFVLKLHIPVSNDARFSDIIIVCLLFRFTPVLQAAALCSCLSFCLGAGIFDFAGFTDNIFYCSVARFNWNRINAALSLNTTTTTTIKLSQ